MNKTTLHTKWGPVKVSNDLLGQLIEMGATWDMGLLTEEVSDGTKITMKGSLSIPTTWKFQVGKVDGIPTHVYISNGERSVLAMNCF